jgi:hypothetical protein
MHPARVVTLILVGLSFAAIIVGLAYGAVTPSPQDEAGGLAIGIVAGMCAVGAAIAAFIWWLSRK